MRTGRPGPGFPLAHSVAEPLPFVGGLSAPPWLLSGALGVSSSPPESQEEPRVRL